MSDTDPGNAEMHLVNPHDIFRDQNMISGLNLNQNGQIFDKDSTFIMDELAVTDDDLNLSVFCNYS